MTDLAAENESLRRTVARLERRAASLERTLGRLDKMLVGSDAVSSNLLREQARFTAELEAHERALKSALDRIREDLAESRVFQEALLPVLPEHPAIALAAAYRPADEVGGDLYDVVLDGDRLRIFMGDTTGHGVQAALRTIVARSFLARHQDAPTPARLLEALNDDLVAAHGRLVRLSACCVDIDLAPTPARATYANAGAPALFRVQRGEVEEIYTAGPFLGLLPGSTWTDVAAELDPGCRLFVYTDGLFDQWDDAGELLDDRQVLAALAAGGSTVGEAVEGAVRAGEAFRRGAAQADDLALIGVEIRGP